MNKVIALLAFLIFISINLSGQVDLSNGLVAYYPFNGNAQDASGNNLHGIMRNGVRLTTDMKNQPNQAMLFDGVDDYIEILDDPKLRFTNQFSITFIFNRDPASTTAELVEKRNWTTGSQSSFDIGLIEDAKVRTAVKTGNDCASPINGWLYPTVSDPTLANTWYCVVAVFNNGKLDFYFNGSLVGSNTTAFTSIDNCSGSNVRIGIHLSFDLLPFKGKIDEVRFYNRPLNTGEISQLCVLNNTCNDSPPQGSLTAIPACENTPASVIFNGNANETYDISLLYDNQVIEKKGVVNGQVIDMGKNNVFPAKPAELTSVTDVNGCKSIGSSSINTIVYRSPKPVFESVYEYCIDDRNAYQLKAKETTSLPISSELFEGTSIDADGQFKPVNLNEGINVVKYTATSTDGCSATASTEIMIHPLPRANAGNDIVACQNNAVQLNGSGGTQYHWNPSINLNDDQIPNPIATVVGPTEYELTVQNEFGCSSKDTVVIKITSDNRNFFNLPNAFTPNGDGKNDCFGIQHWGDVELKEFTVFNRWGEIIFSTKEPGKCWNGTYKGKRSDPGTYIYKIKANSSCGEIDKKGVINLLW